MAHREAGEIDTVLRAALELVSGPADDRHLVAALAETRRGLKHLVHRAGVELVELEDLEDAHCFRVIRAQRGISCSPTNGPSKRSREMTAGAPEMPRCARHKLIGYARTPIALALSLLSIAFVSAAQEHQHGAMATVTTSTTTVTRVLVGKSVNFTSSPGEGSGYLSLPAARENIPRSSSFRSGGGWTTGSNSRRIASRRRATSRSRPISIAARSRPTRTSRMS